MSKVAKFLSLGILLLLGGTQIPKAFPDVIIMKDGTVLECKIKQQKFPDPRQRSKFVLVVQVDEKGTIRQISSRDIKRQGAGWAIFKRKTTWERRKKYEKDFARRLKYLVKKDTWRKRESLGKWCKTHLLPGKAEDQYKIAYRMRTAQSDEKIKAGKIKDPIKEHIKLAKWCDRNLGLFDHARKQYMKAYSLKRKALDMSKAESHVRLGRWLQQIKLEDAAVKEYEAAIKKNPKNSSALSALRRIKSSMGFKLKQLAVEYAKYGRAWTITVAIEDQVSKSVLQEWATKMQDLSDYVFTITEGQFFIASCEIQDSTSDAQIIVEKGKLKWRGLSNKQGTGTLAYCTGSGTRGWQVHAPGKAAVGVLAHEIFHGIYGLPDEYYQNPQCDCVMRAAPNPQKLCDSDNHVGGGRNRGPRGSAGKTCWQIIKGRKAFKRSVVHPNPRWAWKDPNGNKQTRKGGRRGYGGEMRSVGGVLKWKGMKVKAPPKMVVRIIDN